MSEDNLEPANVEEEGEVKNDESISEKVIKEEGNQEVIEGEKKVKKKKKKKVTENEKETEEGVVKKKKKKKKVSTETMQNDSESKEETADGASEQVVKKKKKKKVQDPSETSSSTNEDVPRKKKKEKKPTEQSEEVRPIDPPISEPRVMKSSPVGNIANLPRLDDNDDLEVGPKNAKYSFTQGEKLSPVASGRNSVDTPKSQDTSKKDKYVDLPKIESEVKTQQNSTPSKEKPMTLQSFFGIRKPSKSQQPNDTSPDTKARPKRETAKYLVDLLNRQPDKREISDKNGTKIFGEPFVEIPKVILEALSILKKRGTTEEGLFRISGSHAKIQELKLKADQGKKINLEVEGGNIHTISGFLKLYLRELPNHLIPGTKFKEIFLKAAELTDPEYSIPFLRGMLKRLPSSNFRMIKEIFSILHDVVVNNDKTKMSEGTLSIIFSGFILPLNDISRAPLTNRVSCILIKHFDRIFGENPEEIEFFKSGKAVFTHEARYDTELGFTENDELLIFKKFDNDYYYGYHIQSDKFGDVVAKYVQLDGEEATNNEQSVLDYQEEYQYDYTYYENYENYENYEEYYQDNSTYNESDCIDESQYQSYSQDNNYTDDKEVEATSETQKNYGESTETYVEKSVGQTEPNDALSSDTKITEDIIEKPSLSEENMPQLLPEEKTSETNEGSVGEDGVVENGNSISEPSATSVQVEYNINEEF